MANVVVGLTACLFVLLGGCSQPHKGPHEAQQGPVVVEPNELATVVAETAERSVALVLKFTPGQTITCKVTTEAEKSIEWQGDTSRKPAAFEGGRTGHHTEVTFDQHVQRVDDGGNATLKITVKALKYLTRAKDVVIVDFDSARPGDRSGPLAGLIGLGYALVVSPKGEVLSVMDVEPARQALQGDSPEHQTALRLLDEPIIKARHEVQALMTLPSAEVLPGQRWSDIKSLDFGMLGTREFERIYTLEGPEAVDGGRVAVVTMNAIPSSALAQEQHIQQRTNPFAQMFDSTERYEGRLQLNLITGELVAYVEQLHMQWVAADPTATESSASRPAAVKMGATQLHRFDRVK
jgi:hypothetical protein